jgi:HEAT repeat protein
MISAMDAAERALVRVLRDGSKSSLTSWAATGETGIRLLCEELAGRHRTEPGPGIHERDAIDNLAAATVEIAAAHPDAFLAAFDGTDPDNTFVLDGLGQIDDERATVRLARASGSHDPWQRMHAAIGLRRRESPLAREALGRMLKDRDDLVRHHAAASLRHLDRSRSG